MSKAEPKFKVGSFWKTRDGHKVRILANDVEWDEPICGAIYDLSNSTKCLHTRNYCSNGNYYSGNRHDEIDLIEPWVDPPEKRLRLLAYLDRCKEHIRLIESGNSVPHDWTRVPWLDEPEVKS